MKIKAFAVRNAREILRDPLSYVFALGFPVVMLVIMTIVNGSIPAEAGMKIFSLQNLAPAVVIFGYAFVMLFSAILSSKDRCGAFLQRLYAAPVSSAEYLAGYMLPVLVLGLGQAVITYGVAEILAVIFGETLLSPGGMLLSLVLMLPALVLFLCCGLLFGSLFNDKSAPPLTSVLITLTSILGGIFMDVEGLGGTLYAVARWLPFLPAVRLGRSAVCGGVLWADMLPDLLVTIGWAAVVFVAAVAVFRRNRSQSLK